MPRHRRKSNSTSDLAELILRGVIVLALIAYAPLVRWWNSIPSTGRIIIIVLTVVTAASGLGMLWALSEHRKQQRALAWKKAMSTWHKSAQIGTTYLHQSARYLSETELEKFAAQVYARMGYTVRRTGKTGDHGVDVELINPEKQVELVQCKQWNKPVGEPQVRDLYGAMAHIKAACGWLWSPRGFSEPAKRWAKNKPIVLVDDEEIGCLVESAYGNS